MKINAYVLHARIYPCIITLIPYFIIWYFLLKDPLMDFFSFMNNIKVFGHFGIFAVMLYVLWLTNRTIGKFIFEHIYFQKGDSFPTTIALLPNSTIYSEEYLKLISKKTQKEFGLSLPNQDNINNNKDNSIKRIVEIVSHMRNKVKEGHLLLQHNYEYGFWRNLIGGTPILILSSLVSLYFLYKYNIKTGVILMIIVFSVSTLLLILSKRFMKSYGNIYAKILIQEFMNS